MNKILKKILSSLIFASLFYTAYQFDVTTLKVLYWVLFTIVIFVALVIEFVNFKMKKDETFIEKVEKTEINQLVWYDVILGLINIISMTAISLKFEAYNILSYILIGYCSLWYTYYRFLKTLKDRV